MAEKRIAPPKSISQLRNLGPKTEKLLREVGVETDRDLLRIGAVEAFRRLKFADRKTSLNALYAIEAALRDIDWRALTSAEKSLLKRRAGIEPD